MSERRTGLEGWGAGESERSWWRRGYDPIGRHTTAAAVLGVLLAALVGAAFDPLNLRTSDDLDRAERAAYEEARIEVEADGYQAGLPYGEVQHFGQQFTEELAGQDNPYANRFRDGWVAGWNDALEAMFDAATDAGLPQDYTEFRVLEDTARR